MRSSSIIMCVLIAISIFSGCDSSSYTDTVKPKRSVEKEINERLDEITDLHQKLISKNKEVKEARESFETEVASYRKEIMQAERAGKVSSFEGALSDYRVKNNLTLIQQRLAYIAKLKQFEQGIVRGSEDVFFLKRKTEGDLKMIEVLDEEEIKLLISQIDMVIKKYMPYADKLVVNIDGMTLKGQREIWNDILRESELQQLEESRIAEKMKIEREREEQKIREAQEQERQRQIKKMEEIKRQEEYAKSPAGHLESLLDQGMFPLDWYKRLDNKYIYHVKDKQLLKEKSHSTIHISQIINLKNYFIIELIWKYENGAYGTFINFNSVKLMDSKGAFNFPKYVFEESGRKCPTSSMLDVREGYIKSYHVYCCLDFEKVKNGNLLYGNSDQFLLEYVIK